MFRSHITSESSVTLQPFFFVVRLLALKRMFVNNEKDLAVCKREINIVVSICKVSRDLEMYL